MILRRVDRLLLVLERFLNERWCCRLARVAGGRLGGRQEALQRSSAGLCRLDRTGHASDRLLGTLLHAAQRRAYPHGHAHAHAERKNIMELGGTRLLRHALADALAGLGNGRALPAEP